MSFTLIALTFLALSYAYLNGIHDSSNLVSTMVTSRALGGRAALLLVAAAVLAGPFLLGVAVATTLGTQVIDPPAASPGILIAALAGAILWSGLTWFLGIPSSSSHALIGGMIGATWAGAGLDAILIGGLEKVLIALFLSPLAGLLLGFFITRLVVLLAWNATPRINYFFKRAQVLASLAVAISYGANDAQKTMGILTLGLVSAGALESFQIPTWVLVASALSLALGSATGGWSLIRTLGGKFYKIKPLDGFCAQLTSALIVIGASLAGGPVSTTQVVSTAIMGVGAAERMSRVRWGVAREITLTWLVTIPLTALLSAGLYWFGALIVSGF